MIDTKYKAMSVISGNVTKRQWVYGYYVNHLNVTPPALFHDEDHRKKFIDENTMHLIIHDGFSDWNMPRGFRITDIDIKTLCMSTNHKDKNGVEIYDGDYGYYDGFKYTVAWDKEKASFIFISTEADENYEYKEPFGDLEDTTKWFEIGGNIHEEDQVK